MDSNYLTDIYIEGDLGGYGIISENIVDTKILKQGKLKGRIPEYIDVI